MGGENFSTCFYHHGGIRIKTNCSLILGRVCSGRVAPLIHSRSKARHAPNLCYLTCHSYLHLSRKVNYNHSKMKMSDKGVDSSEIVMLPSLQKGLWLHRCAKKTDFSGLSLYILFEIGLRSLILQHCERSEHHWDILS